jgi:hypothetical protein
MPQSLLDTMNYEQLKSLAESRGCLPSEPHNSEEIRKAIHDWELDRGLPFKGLKELITNENKSIDLSGVLEALTEINERLKRIETHIGVDNA